MKREIVNTIKDEEYKEFIFQIKAQIQSTQIKAAVSVNKEMLRLYWFIALSIIEKQKQISWGDGLIKQVSKDLQNEFPEMKGFSIRNIKYMRQWCIFWMNEKSIAKQVVSQLNSIGQQVVAQLENEIIFQIPWGQNLVIISKSKSKEEAIFYLQKTIEFNWSRAVLVHHIELGLYEREGKATTNFEQKLPKPQSDLAIQTLKDPYCFDFLTLTKKYNEKELEDALVDNITKFLLELGAGFSFLGKQYKLVVDDRDFYIDLLFYNIKLHSYVVIELKAGKFKPEYAGKLNFYVAAVDDLIADRTIDNPTIGIIICKSKSRTVVEYALKGVKTPIGVSEYELTKVLPDEFKSTLPTIEEIELEIGGFDG